MILDLAPKLSFVNFLDIKLVKKYKGLKIEIPV